jgi:hypothetical protein
METQDLHFACEISSIVTYNLRAMENYIRAAILPICQCFDTVFVSALFVLA